MERTPVKSSNIASIGYEEPTQTLETEFRSGHIYHHFGVPPQVHSDLMEADSIGKSFNQLIKNGGFKYEKLEPEQK